MMKKLLTALLALMLLTTAALAEDTVTALEAGNYDILFSNGYRGYCIDYGKQEADVNDVFRMTDTSKADNNETGEDISQHLKILFIENFDTLFKADGDTYVTDDKIKPQYYVWYFSDDKENWRLDPKVTDRIIALVKSGMTIPDHGYTIVRDGKEIRFDFAVMKNTQESRDSYQDFFAYKITVYEHAWAEEWETDGEHHWHVCEADGCTITDKSQMAGYGSHTGGTATCTDPAQCSVCGEAYGDVAADDHAGHGTYIVGDRSAGAEEGYTGDVYCSGCRALIRKGEAIPAGTLAALPQTGDESRPFLWAALLLVSAAGLACCGRRSRT